MIQSGTYISKLLQILAVPSRTPVSPSLCLIPIHFNVKLAERSICYKLHAIKSLRELHVMWLGWQCGCSSDARIKGGIHEPNRSVPRPQTRVGPAGELGS